MSGILIFLCLLYHFHCGKAACPVGGCVPNAHCDGDCQCDDGYDGNPNVECLNINECDFAPTDAEYPCAANTDCTDQTPDQDSGALFICECNAGYESADPIIIDCTDIDECTFPLLYPCAANTDCDNTAPGFECSCAFGFIPEFPGDNPLIDDCIVDVECDAFGGSCDPNADCVNTAGVYSCVCDAGYLDTDSDPVVADCEDINECDNLATCGVNTLCVNLVGSAYCECLPGWTGDASIPTGCSTDINECESNADDCPQNELCCNIADGGGFSCQCGGSCSSAGSSCGAGTYCSLGGECIVPRPPGSGDDCLCNADCTTSGLDASCLSAYCGWDADALKYKCTVDFHPSLTTCCDEADTFSCTVDVCDGLGHCVHPTNDDQCDPNLCQTNGVCIGTDGDADGCTYTGVTCGPDDDGCGIDGVCDIVNGKCDYTPSNSACGADTGCTTYTCHNGQDCDISPDALCTSCSHTTSTEGGCGGDECECCTGSLCECITDNCDANGFCIPPTNLPPGAACSVHDLLGLDCRYQECDGSGTCSIYDDVVLCEPDYPCQSVQCELGVCVSYDTGGDQCHDGLECTTDTCNPTHPDANPNTGCLFTPEDAECTSAIGCHVGVCDPLGIHPLWGSFPLEEFTGCRYGEDNAYCNVVNDGDDGLSCTEGVCDPHATNCLDPVTGCVHTPHNERCTLANDCEEGICDPTIPVELREGDGSGCYYEVDDSQCVASLCGFGICNDAGTGCDYQPHDDYCDGAHNPDLIENVCKVFECNPDPSALEDGCMETLKDSGCLCSLDSTIQGGFNTALGCNGAGENAVCIAGVCVCLSLAPTPAPVDPLFCDTCTTPGDCAAFCACERDAHSISVGFTDEKLGALCACNHLHPLVYETCTAWIGGTKTADEAAECMCDNRLECGGDAVPNCDPSPWVDTCAGYGQCCCQCTYDAEFPTCSAPSGWTQPGQPGAQSVFGNAISDDGDIWNWQQVNENNNGDDINTEPKKYTNGFYNDYINDNDGNTKTIEYNVKLSPQMMAIVGGLLLLLVGNIIYCKIKKSNIKRNASYNENQKEQEQNV